MMSTYLTPQEVADRLGVSVFTIRRYIRNGKLKAVKLDGVFRISRDDLADFLRLREVGYLPPAPTEPAAGPASPENGGGAPTIAAPPAKEPLPQLTSNR